MSKLLIGILLLLCAVEVSAQSITGKVTDNNSKQTIPNAGITLFGSTGTLIASTISTSTGTFDLHYKLSGKYRLRVSFVGYQSLEKELILTGQSLSVGILRLMEKSQNLTEVVVKATIPLATQRGDTTVMNASAYKTNPDATVQDLVQKMPGIVVQDGKLQAHGEEVKQVLVDGKEFFKDDVSTALKNLPASIVNEIQVYDSQSDQTRFTGFDDGNRLKTINIVTKTGVTKSQFGRFEAGGGGPDNLYTAGGDLNLFNNDRRISIVTQFNNTNEQNFAMGNMFNDSGNSNGPPGSQAPSMGGTTSSGNSVSNYSVDTKNGITKTNAVGINYSDQWGKNIKVSGNYFVNYSNNSSIQNSLYDYIVNTGEVYTENKHTAANTTNQRLNFRVDYDIDDNNSLFIRPSINLQQSNGTTSTIARTDSIMQPLNSFTSSTDPTLKGAKFSGEVLYRHKFNRKGRTLSLDINSTSQTSNGTNYLNSITNYYTLNTIDTVREYAQIHSTGYSFSTNASYTEPLNRRSMVMFNYMYGYQNGKSNQQAYNYTNSTHLYDKPDSSLTNIYRNIYTTNSAGLSYLYHKTDINFNARLNYQHANLTGENELSNSQLIPAKSYDNLLPSMMLRYKVNTNSNLQLDYHTTASAPSISQLQEVVDNSNPTQLVIGNSHLAQTYQHNISMRFISSIPSNSSVLMCFLNGSSSNNYIANKTYIAKSDTTLNNYNIHLPQGSQLTTYANMAGYYSLNGMIGYGFPFTPIKTNINVMLNTSVNRTPSIVNNQKNISKQATYGTDLVLSSNISQNIDFRINSRVKYNTVDNSLEGQTDSRYWNVSSGVNFSFILLQHLVMSTDYSFSGYYQSGNQNEITNLLNCSLGFKFLKQNAGDLRFTACDLLNQNTNFSRTTTPLYILTQQSNTLGRHFLLTFSYTLRNFSGNNSHIL